MVGTKRNWNAVITKIFFYVSSTTKQKMKVGATKIQPDDSDKKELEKEVTTKI